MEGTPIPHPSRKSFVVSRYRKDGPISSKDRVRRLAGVAAVIATIATIAPTTAHADDVSEWATYAQIDETDLRGAVATTGLSPESYLLMTGEVVKSEAPPAVASTYAPSGATASNPRVDCIISHESRGNPSAVNPSSGAAGLGQFLPSTWASTPQGRAGYSVFNAEANRAAVAWMVSVGRAREFQVVGVYGC